MKMGILCEGWLEEPTPPSRGFSKPFRFTLTDGLLICSISEDSRDIYKLLDAFDGRAVSLGNRRRGGNGMMEYGNRGVGDRVVKKIIFWVFVLVLIAGCKTTKVDPVAEPISWSQQKAYLSRVRDPRVFGLSIYETPAGLQLRGGGRVHPSQGAALKMKAEEPFRPVVKLAGNFKREYPVLLDFVSTRSWLEFGAAQKMRATPVAERKPELIRLPNEEIPACLSIVSKFRLDQLHIENPLVYVRMAKGSIGSVSRGIDDLDLAGVIGWDLLRKMEQIRFLYSIGQVVLFTTEPYDPDPSLVIAAVPLVKHAGACAVRGKVDGKEQLVLIDPAGDFEVAGTSSNIELAPNLVFSSSEDSVSPGGVRIGARALQMYEISICPKVGLIYFEQQPKGEK